MDGEDPFLVWLLRPAGSVEYPVKGGFNPCHAVCFEAGYIQTLGLNRCRGDGEVVSLVDHDSFIVVIGADFAVRRGRS